MNQKFKTIAYQLQEMDNSFHRSPEYNKIALRLEEIEDKVKELDPELASEIDVATGEYSSYMSTSSYIQGFRDCLQMIFSFLGA